MSLDQVEALLSAIRDRPGFALQVAQAPHVLTGYDLSAEERRALVENDTAALRELGVDERLIPAAAVIGRPR